IRRLADLRYAGQAYELTVPVPEGPLRREDIVGVVHAFEQEHLRTYGHNANGEPVDLVNIRVVGSAPPRGNRTYSPEAALGINRGKGGSRSASRPAYFGR